MAEVGHVTPGKPIWPEHHGEIPDRRAPHKEDEEPKKRAPRPDQDDDEVPPEDKPGGGHLDEYA